jgi:hypothetical protein
MSDENLTLPWAKFASEDLKRVFAGHLYVRPDTLTGRHEAALLTFPDPIDQLTMLRARDDWPFDVVVIQEIARLKSEAEKKVNELPSLEEQARAVYNLANDGTKGVDDRLKAHKLYAELRGFIKKPGEGVQVVNYQDNRKVHYYPIQPSTPEAIEDFEKIAVAHQAKLVSSAAR